MDRADITEQIAARRARMRERRRAGQARMARRTLAAFVRLAIEAGEIDGISRVEWGPLLDLYCHEVQLQLEAWLVANGHGDSRMIARQREAWERTGATWEDREPEPWLRYVLVQNQIDNLPPGTLKSTITMVCACAWIWLWCPKFAFGALSGVDANVSRDSNATRDLVRSDWYRETFRVAWATVELDVDESGDDDEGADVDVRRDRSSVSDWATTAGGKRISRTLTRGISGLHVDGVFVDDPDDADRVWSESERLRTQNRWARAAENRVNDEHKSLRRIVQQVPHSECLSVYLMSVARWSAANPKGWAQLCLPAEYGYGPDTAPIETPWGSRDWRSVKGETLHQRLSPGVLADKRLKLGELVYAYQYNQSTESIANGIFKPEAARFFVLEGQPIVALRKRPEGARSRELAPPVVVRLSDLRRITLSVDAANSIDPSPTDKKISAVGLVVLGSPPSTDERCVLHDATRVLGASATYQAIYHLISSWALDRILVEKKAMGPSVIAEIEKAIRLGWYVDDKGERRELRGPDGKRTRAVVEVYDPGRDSKDARSIAMVPPWEQGRLLLLDGAEWLYPKFDENRKIVDEGLFREICAFPRSRRRDRIDSIAQDMATLAGADDVRERIRLWSMT